MEQEKSLFSLHIVRLLFQHFPMSEMINPEMNKYQNENGPAYTKSTWLYAKG
jgi:hypothetical protein